MKKALLCCIIAGLASTACKKEQTQATAQKSLTKPFASISVLEWVVTASPTADAQKAIAENDHRLWGYHDRGGAHIIGVANSEVEKMLMQYQLRTAPGISDTTFGDRHEQLRSKFFEYAKQYNHIILTK